MDKYKNFSELKAHEHEGRDFEIIAEIRNPSTTAIIAPHGGGIEPGTSELAIAIAQNAMHIAIFEGIKTSGNLVLHITSTHFDEPKCVGVVEQSDAVIALHGEQSSEKTTYIGGADTVLRDSISKALEDAGFNVKEHPEEHLQGTSPLNICNRGKQKKGVQLELARGLRETFFASLRSKGRLSKTPAFHKFVKAVRQGLQDTGIS
jgi:phage replication-related protein YjqB (UPF0714/DUF867 family)